MLLAKDTYQHWINAKDAIKTNRYYCPDCHAKLILKSGPKMICHFAHVKKCPQQRFSDGETMEHVSGKQLLYEKLSALGYQVELEPYLKELKQRPDLLVRHNNKKIAIEFQCSVISHDIIEKRTQCYYQYHYDVIWIVGKKNARLTNLTYYYLNTQLYQFYLDTLTRTLYIKMNNVMKAVAFECLFQPIVNLTFELLSYTKKEKPLLTKYFKRRFLQFLYCSQYTIQDIPDILLNQRTKIFGTNYYQYEWLVWLYVYYQSNQPDELLLEQFKQYTQLTSMPCIKQHDLIHYYIQALQKRLHMLLKEYKE